MLAIVSGSAAFAPVVTVAPATSRAAAPQMGFGKAELMGEAAEASKIASGRADGQEEALKSSVRRR